MAESDTELCSSYGTSSENQSSGESAPPPPPDPISAREQLKICCKPTYTIRRVKTKGAILILAWNLLAMTAFWYVSSTSFRGRIPHDNGSTISAIVFGFTLPIAGWLADACVGRYRMIYCSSLITWVATIMETAIETFVSSYAPIRVVKQGLFGLMGLGLGGFLSTVVQFGFDQLPFAKTDEVSAYIMWLAWTSGFPLIIMNFTFSYFYINGQSLMFLGYLILCVNFSLILISLFCCNHWLIKDPMPQNPFKLIYHVTKYAIKHKYLQRRSAFTFCEDEVISRIDLGKNKYGGPFTTEQVEDVKTFFRILPIVAICGMFLGEIAAANLLDYALKLQFVYHKHDSKIKYITNHSISMIIPFSMPLLAVLYEVCLSPIFYRCCQRVTSLHRFFVGATMLIGTFLALMIFELLSRQSYLQENGYNETVLCVLYKHQALATKFNYTWIAIPDILFALSILLMVVGCVEFMAAQVPCSMKGVLLGVCFGSAMITGTIDSLLTVYGPFRQNLSIRGTKLIDCGFWYALFHIILSTFGCIVCALIVKWYKRRKREDVLPHEYIYAERYYSNEDYYSNNCCKKLINET